MGHAVLIVAILRWPASSRGVLRDWYPLLLMPLFYAEIPLLNQCWSSGYRDARILALESAVCGGQPSRTLAAALPFTPLSELLHLCYLSYYPLIFVPPLLLYVQGRRAEFGHTVLAVMVTFYVCYVCFIYYPVEGPRYLWPVPTAVPRGMIQALAQRILELGSSRGAAFPSAHVAVAVTQSLLALRQQVKLAPLLILLTMGMGVGAVYGGFHYCVDVLAGALIASLAIAITHRLPQSAQ